MRKFDYGGSIIIFPGHLIPVSSTNSSLCCFEPHSELLKKIVCLFSECFGNNAGFAFFVVSKFLWLICFFRNSSILKEKLLRSPESIQRSPLNVQRRGCRKYCLNLVSAPMFSLPQISSSFELSILHRWYVHDMQHSHWLILQQEAMSWWCLKICLVFDVGFFFLKLECLQLSFVGNNDLNLYCTNLLPEVLPYFFSSWKIIFQIQLVAFEENNTWNNYVFFLRNLCLISNNL